MIKQICLMLPFMMIGCVTHKSATYLDPHLRESTNADFGGGDFNYAVDKMTNSLLTFQPLQERLEQRPIVFISSIENKTSNHIEVEALAESVRTKLIQSGKFRFIDRNRIDDILDELSLQSRAGLVDPNTAIRAGKLLGAEYMIYGNLVSLVQREAGAKEAFYQINLNLMDAETGLLVWSDEAQIRKFHKRRLFGR